MTAKQHRAEEPAPLTPAVFHILLSLADGPRHGYAIMQSVKETAGLEMGPGTIYGSIQRMEEAELVEAIDPSDLPEPGDARRRYCGLTSQGRKALESESARLARIAQIVRDKKLVPGGRSAR